RLLEAGYNPVPVPPGQKGPRTRGWQNLELTETDLPNYFKADSNVGVLLGDPGGGLVDIDLDWPEAIALADQFLPPTAMISGRPGARRSHRFFVTNPSMKTAQFAAPSVPGDRNRAMIVEIRSTGGQAVLPPSRHPS